MKQKIYLTTGLFLMLFYCSISQPFIIKQVIHNIGQTGIKKKVSELKKVKAIEKEPILAYSNLLKSRFGNFYDLIAPLEKNKDERSTKLFQEAGEKPEAALEKTSSVSTISTLSVWSNFLSGDYLEDPFPYRIPPDINGSVSASQIIVTSKFSIKVFDKPAVTDLPVVTPAGYSRDMAPSTLSLGSDQFFSPVLPEGSFIDFIQIRYDRLSKRWFVTAIEASPTKSENNLVLLAVSNEERITEASSFTYYSFNSSLLPYDESAPYGPLLFSATLGVDKHSVLIGGVQSGYMFRRFVGYVIDKEKLIKGNLSVNPFELGRVDDAPRHIKGLLSPQGVYNDDPAAKKSFFIGTNGTFDSLVIASIEYDKRKMPVLASESFIKVADWNRLSSISSPGSLTPITLPGNNPLTSAAIYKNKLTGNSSLWTAHTIGVSRNGTYVNGSEDDFVKEARNGSRWYNISNIYTKPTLLQTGTVYDADKKSGRRARHYFNSSIATSGQGRTIISGTTTAFNEYLNVFAAQRYTEDESGKMKSPVKVTNAKAIYAPYYFDEIGRKNYIGDWGRYSQTVLDPLDDQTIWTFQEYANVDDSYGLRAVQFKAPPPANPIAPGTLSNKTDTTITIKGESEDDSGFFDPGKDAGGPGYNRLSVKSTGNIIVSNIKFLSPTEISFRLNTKNKASGNYLLIITNPDGQIVVTAYKVAAGSSALVAGNKLSERRALDDKVGRHEVIKFGVHPNPTSGNAILEIDAPKENKAEVVLFTMEAKEVFRKSYSLAKGTNEVILPTEGFIKGTYIAVVYNSDKVLVATQKVIKQ